MSDVLLEVRKMLAQGKEKEKKRGQFMLLKREGGAREAHQDREPRPPYPSQDPVTSTSQGRWAPGNSTEKAGTAFLGPLRKPFGQLPELPAEGTRAETPQNHSKDTSGKTGLMWVTAS